MISLISVQSRDFPLWDEGKRVFQPTEAGVLFEEPLLLDPAEAADPPLLTFNEEGMAMPRRTDPHAKAYKRAQTSILLYHLNRSKLKNIRQATICNRIVMLIEEGKKQLLLEALEQSVAARVSYSTVVKQLSDMIQADAPYAAAAKAMLKTYRNLEWVEELLDAA